MCMGGPKINRKKAKPAVINMPDFDRYDREFDLQKSAIDQQMNSSMTAMQGQLNDALREQTDLKEKIADAKKAEVAETAAAQKALEEKAARLSVLIGPPPPEKTASAPEIGVRDRDIKTRKGKKALRIGRKVARSSGQGTGLNIT
tara:strand:+ start:170 stop:604 length:435 start_codon:yes stop_codon:yes gene_type:complete